MIKILKQFKNKILNVNRKEKEEITKKKKRLKKKMVPYPLQLRKQILCKTFDDYYLKRK